MSMESNQAGVVIIGAGLAGWGVIDAIRAKDKNIPITLITSDNADRYHKPMLTMAISQNKSAADLVRATGVEAAKNAGVTLLANTYVTQIDSHSQQVQVRSVAGKDTNTNTNTDVTTRAIKYDKLVLAMGAQPIFPSSLPIDIVWHVNHIERFGQLQQALEKGPQKIAIVGAGMVGTEIAEDLLKAGHDITLMDLNNAPLAQMLPEAATARIKQAIDSQGIHFLGGSLVQSVTKLKNNQLQVMYASINDEQHPQTLVVDHVIASTGLSIDAALPESANIEFDKRTGIRVDEATLQTSQPNIFAIGDCMSISGVPCRYVAPLRSQAATIAEQVLAGQVEDVQYQPYVHKPPMIRLKNKAISVIVTGVPSNTGNWQVVTSTDDELVMVQLDEQDNTTANVTIKS